VQLGRCPIELVRGQFGQQVCVGLVRERVFRRSSWYSVIQIAVGQDQLACTHLFEQREITVDGRINAPYIQIFPFAGWGYRTPGP
jgi:hypothetical protein